ncbi:TlpA disulfide reductase family protein [Candidatus Accumulibacter sp. ACC005]|jgi:thiol-disulfide isomerase/thioredoxin|uniref:TlpA family protein disulfide reductase n=1 Tax=Candidatus Accumulibacter sp. ACC005 TaxID=2823331 RepID=UPI0025B8A132|nr:TlpA disulfide reductase family protein [Candidatus Accumulibacter sp. ACC005]
MSRGRGFLIGLLAAIIALLAAIYNATQHSSTVQRAFAAVPPDAVAHLFATTLDDENGLPQPLSQWRGKTLVVNFWATWCPPCREEMPAFSRLQRAYAANGVQFVGIALDSADSVRDFSERHPVAYPLLMGGAKGVELAGQFGNSSLSLPYTIVLDQDGAGRLLRLGPLAESELDDFLRKLTAR